MARGSQVVTLGFLIGRLRDRTKQAGEIAELCAAELLDECRKTASAGTDPYGVPWRETQEGKEAMKNAAAHISVSTSGPTIRVTLKGPDALHNYGASKGGIKRQVIWNGKGDLPPGYTAAINRGIKKWLDRT